MSTVTEVPQLFTTPQVADLLGVSKYTVDRLRKAGQITPLRVGVGSHRVRYSAVEVNRYIDSLGPDAQDSP